MIKWLYILYFCLFIQLISFAQSTKIDKKNAAFTIRGSGGVPASFSSNMFKFGFKGVYEFDITVNYKLFDNFHIGLGYRQTLFKNNPKYFTYYKDPRTTFTIPYDTRFQVQSFILNLGYDHFFTDKFYITYNIQSGIANSQFLKVIQDTSFYNRPYQPSDYQSPFIKAQGTFNFIVEPKLSFNFYFGYQSLLFNYDPRSSRMNQYEELRNKSNKQGIAWLSFGFGFNVLLDNKNK